MRSCLYVAWARCGTLRKLDGLRTVLHQKVRLHRARARATRFDFGCNPTTPRPPAREEMLGSDQRHGRAQPGQGHHQLAHPARHRVCVQRGGRDEARADRWRPGNIEQMRQTDENLLELRVKGDMEHFIAELSSIGCECRLNERDTIQVATPDGMPTGAIYAIAQKLNVQIRHLYARADSLEDIFIKVMEDESGAEPGTSTRDSTTMRG